MKYEHRSAVPQEKSRKSISQSLKLVNMGVAIVEVPVAAAKAAASWGAASPGELHRIPSIFSERLKIGVDSRTRMPDVSDIAARSQSSELHDSLCFREDDNATAAQEVWRYADPFKLCSDRFNQGRVVMA